MNRIPNTPNRPVFSENPHINSTNYMSFRQQRRGRKTCIGFHTDKHTHKPLQLGDLRPAIKGDFLFFPGDPEGNKYRLLFGTQQPKSATKGFTRRITPCFLSLSAFDININGTESWKLNEARHHGWMERREKNNKILHVTANKWFPRLPRKEGKRLPCIIFIVSFLISS